MVPVEGPLGLIFDRRIERLEEVDLLEPLVRLGRGTEG